MRVGDDYTKRDFVNARLTNQPTVTVDLDPRQTESVGVSVHGLDPDLLVSLCTFAQAGRRLQSILRVTVVGIDAPEIDAPEGEGPPDVFARYQILADGIRFIPHLPFERGVLYRASFDPRPIGRPELSQVLTVKFSLPKQRRALPTEVEHIFPSSDCLPENLLRFYVHFSNSMQRGRAESEIALLGPDGRPVSDVLYRPPVELWDRTMRRLTVLLDPGRIKRWLGPNAELGPPLKAGQAFTLAIGSGMSDFSGRPLRKTFHKRFSVTAAVREPIAVAQWRIAPPAANSRHPLVLTFPRPLDRALISHSIGIAQKGMSAMDGRIVTDRCETRWSFTPTSPWAVGSYEIRVASTLEDVCGNGVIAAFDRPLRSCSNLADEVGKPRIEFEVL